VSRGPEPWEPTLRGARSIFSRIHDPKGRFSHDLRDVVETQTVDVRPARCYKGHLTKQGLSAGRGCICRDVAARRGKRAWFCQGPEASQRGAPDSDAGAVNKGER
jgi:hypothetical protein